MAISYANVQVTKVLTLRGNTIQNNRYTGLPGELTVDTEAKTIRIHDGVTPGGNVIQGGGSGGPSSYGNANVKVYLTTFDGNIVPSANAVYSLGNSTTWWKDLWLSENTLYIGGVPIGSSGGSLTFGGNVVGTSDLPSYTGPISANAISVGSTIVGNITTLPKVSIAGTSGNITAGNISTTGELITGGDISTPGNISTTGGFTASDLSFKLSAAGAVIELSATNFKGSGYVPGRIYETATDGPGTGLRVMVVDVEYGPGSYASIGSPADGAVKIIDPGSGYTNGGLVYLSIRYPGESGTNALLTVYTQVNPVTYGTITANTSVWSFDESGNTTVPGDILLPDNTAIYNVDANTAVFTTNSISDATSIYLTDSGNAAVYASDSVVLETNSDGNVSQQWAFNQNGNVVFPDNTTQSTAFSNTAPIIITLSSNITAANVGLKGYVDLANTIQSAQLTAANTAWAANASAQQTLISNLQASAYSNSNVSAFLVSHTDQTIGGNLTIQGNLTVNGNVSYISVNNLVIGDNIINLADLNPADSLDLGFAAHRTPSGQPMQHTGLIRDASANQWRLFSNVVPAPGTTVDFTNAIYDDLQLGNITSTGNITANYFIGYTEGLVGSITNLTSLNLTVENIGARIAENGVNIGAGGNNNLVVLPTEVMIQNVPLTVAGNIIANETNGLYITANLPVGGTAQIWNFGSDGRLAFPGTPVIDTDANNFDVIGAESVSLEANAVVNIYTDTGGSAYQWQFGNDGNLTFPDNTVQTTAFPGFNGYATNANVTAANVGMKGYVDSLTYSNVQTAAYLTTNSYLTSATANLSLYAWNANITGGGSNYSNANVASYLPTYSGNIANLTLGPSGILTFADGTTQITAGGAGGSYSNVNVTTFLANSRTTFFGNTSTHPLSSNVTQIFIGNSTALTSGNGTSPFATSLMYNMYFAANNTPLVRNTQLGAGILSLDLNGFTVSGLATSQTANAAPTLTNLLRITSAGAATFVGTVAAGGVTSVGAIAVNSALGITSNQATQLIFNQTVTTITMGTGAATTINLGTTAAPTSNVFVGGTLGTNVYGLTLRANGQFNLVTSLTSSGGYATTTYTGIPVTGGSGNGMIISMSGVASGYLGSATITNPGTGYRSGDTITIPAGNPVGSLGGSFVLQNYHATRSNIGTGIWQLGIDGNLTLAGNVIFPSNSYIFGDFSNATVNARTVFTPSAANASPGIYAAPSGSGTGASWQAANSGNLTAASKILIATNGSTDVQLVSGINGSGTYLPLSFYNNGSAQMQLTVSGNLNMTVNNSVATSGTGYFIGNAVGTTATYIGNVTAANFVGNISITGNVTGTSANVTLQAGAYTSVFDNQGNVRLPTAYVTGNVTANYFIGNGALLTGIVAGSDYSNVQVATYLPTYSGNIANIRLGVAGVLTFADGTTQITAGGAGGSSYSNVNVAAYLTTYGGAIQSSNVQTTTANIQATTAATNPATGALRVMGGVGVAGAVFAGQLNTTGNLIANAISAYSLNTVANVTASVVNAGTINSAGNVLAQNIIGTIATASQTNITAVGTLATLSVTGNATVGNLIGTESNTRIIANSFVSTFDIYGNVSFPGNVNVSGLGVTMPARPAFRVIGNGGQITATANITSGNFTVDYNQGNYLTTSTGVFTAPIAGLYSVHLVVRTATNNNLTINQAAVLQNNANVMCMVEFGANTSMNHTGVSTIAKLAVGDVLTAKVLVGTISFDGNDNWSVAYIG